MVNFIIFLTLFSVTRFASGSSLKVVENFFSREEREQILQERTVVAPSRRRHQGHAVVPHHLANRLADLSFEQSCSKYYEANGIIVTTSTLKETSKPHTDKLGPTTVNGEVGFVVLNDNVDATFVHDNEAVPVKSGYLVTFEGDVLHHTIIPSGGTVELLGPFALGSLRPVGGVLLCQACFAESGSSVVQARFMDCPEEPEPEDPPPYSDSNWEVSLLIVQYGEKQIGVPFVAGQELQCDKVVSYSLVELIQPEWEGLDAFIEIANPFTGEMFQTETFSIGSG